MKKIQLISLMLAVCVLLTACAKSATEDTANLPELPFGGELQAILDNGLEQYDQGKGISAAFIVPGYQPWAGVSGISHGTITITPETIFDAGSTHKIFTAAVILQLAEEGLLSLDDPLNKWVPDYPHVDNTITIRQLLNHTGGVFDMVRHPEYWDAVIADPFRIWEQDETLQYYLLEPYFPKGEGWHYSTPGYILLRMIIEEATGEDLGTVYRTRLFDPLQLDHTYLAIYEELPENKAHGWFDLDLDGVFEELPSSNSFNSSTGGAIFSTPEDLTKWSHALFHERRVLSEDSLEQMLTFQQTTSDEPLLAGYGLGAANYSPELFNGLEIWGHSGNAAGYVAASFYLPDYEVSFSIMLNTHDGPMMIVADLLNVAADYLENIQ